jgi:hypothetical protein
MTKQTIVSWKLSVTWSDGKTEGLAVDLPEYLHDELQTYFWELEDLREEHDNDLRDEPYAFSADESEAGVVAYFEARAGAHQVARFSDEETYMACVPALESLAKSQGYTLTEALIEGGKL